MDLHLGSSKGTINIEENTFIGSGIKIIKNIEVTEQSIIIIIQKNAFQGKYQRSVVEMRNMKNIFLNSNSFEIVYFAYPSSKDAAKSSGITCDNSDIKLFNTSFKHVTFSTVLHLNNCSAKIENINFLNNMPTHVTPHSTLIYMANSKGNCSNVNFANNKECICIQIWKGTFLAQNISFFTNQFNSSDSMMNIRASHLILINVTAVNNTGQVMSISQSTGNISLSHG